MCSGLLILWMRHHVLADSKCNKILVLVMYINFLIIYQYLPPDKELFSVSVSFSYTVWSYHKIWICSGISALACFSYSICLWCIYMHFFFFINCYFNISMQVLFAKEYDLWYFEIHFLFVNVLVYNWACRAIGETICNLECVRC
jgi:hypothetical protein